jgi:hypothetical protein
MYRRITAPLRLTLALGFLLAGPVMAGEVVIVMGLGAAPLSKGQITDIYLGRSNALKPLDLPPSNVLRDAFYEKATDRDASQVRAVWSRLIFTGQGQPPKELADDDAIKKAVAADPKMVGYIDRSHLDATVKVVLSLH